MQAIARQTGKVPPALAKEVAIPAAGILLLDYFNRLDAGRSYTNEGAPMLLSHQDIYCWCKLTNTALTDYEVTAIRKLDILTINNNYKQRNRG